MRDIKFRAWDNLNKAMFFDGDKYDKREHAGECQVTNKGVYYWLYETRLKNATDSHFDLSRLIMSPEIVLMQFTGLKDKNGKEIYEGDILSNKDTDGNMVVNWCPISAGFCLDKKGWMFSHYFKEAVDANQCEVIGNIYENPELLKG